jgi:signal transduction histidine kinase
MARGLTGRMLAASGLLALILAVTFAVLLTSVVGLRRDQHRARQSEELLVAANRLERLVVDLEAAARGYLLTGDDDFLQTWQEARAALPGQAATVRRLAAGSPGQVALGRRIAAACTSYLDDYSVPLIGIAQRDRAAAGTVAVTEQGKRLTDAIRAAFDEFLATQTALAVARDRRSDAAATRAIAAAAAGLLGSVLLIAGFAGYLTRVIVAPVRRVAAMAGRLAGGDLRARLPDDGVAEIAVLQRSFNTMADALERGRDELAASRTRVVVASDQARRRIERDLHDGTQQRLVTLILELRAAEAAVPRALPRLRTQLADSVEGLTAALDELRELARGIHPTILSEGGLGPALKALARRSPVPVELSVDVPGRLAEPVEAAAYYVVSEALTNATKYAGATVVEVTARVDGDRLDLSVRDDGAGGADPARGSGLIGLHDRVAAAGGTLAVTSPAGEGTTLTVTLPR